MSNGPNAVPYYHHSIPTSYFEGMGWRSWLIRSLNWLRWKFARWVEYHTMILLAKRNGLGDRSTVQALKLRWHEENAEQTHRRSVLATFGQTDVEIGRPKHRYAEGRKNGAWPEDARNELARTLSRARERGGRYATARDTLLVQEVDAELVQ